MKRFIFLTLLFFSVGWNTALDVFTIETKIQTDLDLAISKILPKEQYFFNVSTELSSHPEKKVVGGEVIKNNLEKRSVLEEESSVELMPGFFPEIGEETNPEKRVESIQDRQLYRWVDSPELEHIQVNVGIDLSVDAERVNQVKAIVQGYLDRNYPGQASYHFSRVKMLPPSVTKEIEKPASTVPSSLSSPQPQVQAVQNEQEEEEAPHWLEKNLPWIFLAGFVVLCILFFILFSRKTTTRKSLQEESSQFQQSESKRKVSPLQNESELEKKESLTDPISILPRLQQQRMTVVSSLEEIRSQFIDSVIRKPEPFKRFYFRLTPAQQGELYFSFKGPAFDEFLEKLHISLPTTGEGFELKQLGKKMGEYFDSFQEFLRVQEWEEKQFFGFTRKLTEDQLLVLTTQLQPSWIACMLRFLQPNQSAFLLENLEGKIRFSVLEQLSQLRAFPLQDLLQIEKKTRAMAEDLPREFYGTQKEETEYWGKVLNESLDQDSILSMVEKTNPDLFSHLKKYRFKLEDLPNLPKEVLKKVLSETDNEKLALALQTVSEDTLQYVLKAIPAHRREFLEAQIQSCRSASKEEIALMKSQITKKVREMIA